MDEVERRLLDFAGQKVPFGRRQREQTSDSSTGTNGRLPRRLRPCSKMDGAGSVEDTGVERTAASDSHRDFPSSNILSSVRLAVCMCRSAKPLDWANSGLDVTCFTPITQQNSRNSALQNWVPLSDSSSSGRPKSQKNLDISLMIADDVVDFSGTTHGHLL